MSEFYHALVIEVPGDLSTFSLKQVPFPNLSEGEVLVRMEYTTINPSDIGTVFGKYPVGPPPIVPGLEGSGTVVKSGGGQLADSLVSKRVAIRGNGTWAEYNKAKAEFLFPLLDSTTFEQAANLVVNPMTVALFIEKIQQQGYKAVVQNAAASALGQMFVKWCKRINIPLINLVRRPEQVEVLKNIGAEYVFDTSAENWKTSAIEVSSSLGVSAGFDAIAGTATTDLFELVSPGGVVYNYGRLSGQPCVVGNNHITFSNKKLEGLWVTHWLNSKTHEERVKVGIMIQESFQEVFETTHGRFANLTQVKEIVENYNEISKTNNKVLIRTRIE